MPRVVKRGCAAALLVQGCFLHAASAQKATAVSSLEELQKQAPLPVTRSQLDVSTGQLSAAAADIIGGVTESFLGSDSKISEQERSCLASGASTLAAAVTQSCRDAVSAYHSAHESLQQHQSTLAVSPLAAVNMTSPQAQAQPFPYAGVSPTVASSASPAALTGGEETVVTMEFAARFVGIMELEKQLAKECLQDDAVKRLESAAKHLGNATYMGGRLMANGVDILTEVTDAISAYDSGKLRTFGQDVGGAWRKVLLSKRSYVDFKIPSAEAMDEMTRGLVASLFGNGMTLHVMTDSPMMAAPPAPLPITRGTPPSSWAVPQQQLRGAANPAAAGSSLATAPYQPPANGIAQYPGMVAAPAAVDIDLRTCMVANMPLFRSAWSPVWNLFLDAGKASSAEDAAERELTDSGELLISMLDLQVALRTCGLGPQQEAVLLDGMKLGEVHTSLNMPETRSVTPQQERDNISKSFAQALQDWKEHSWAAFGAQLGSVLRDMIVLTFPQKWSVDDAGRLRNILELTETPSSSHSASKLSQTLGLSVGLFFSASFGMLALVRLRSTPRGESQSLSDMEEENPRSEGGFFLRTLLQEELPLESLE